MKVSELGEFGLIELLTDIVNKSTSARAASGSGYHLLLGIGDDAAVWRTDASIQLATTDTLVQDVHFTLDTATWEELGWKALAINISDIAAMGGIPRYALVTLGLPSHTEVEDAAQLYLGMAQVARKFDVAIVGGDIIGAPVVFISVTLMGITKGEADYPHNILSRSAAMAGDLIAVTGYLGASAAGLQMLKAKIQFDRETTSLLREAHFRPLPRVREGQILLAEGARAAIDISDGLVSDLAKLCQASGVGARIRAHKVPIHPTVRAAFKEDCLRLALGGGEDYELLFTARAEVLDRVKRQIACPVTVIGEIVRDETCQVRLMDAEGKEMRLEEPGWDHFIGKERQRLFIPGMET
jgi:thiamine-monophosphate kinase